MTTKKTTKKEKLATLEARLDAVYIDIESTTDFDARMDMLRIESAIIREMGYFLRAT